MFEENFNNSQDTPQSPFPPPMSTQITQHSTISPNSMLYDQMKESKDKQALNMLSLKELLKYLKKKDDNIPEAIFYINCI